MTEDHQNVPPIAVAPPTRPGMVAEPPARQSGWPKVIGIIAIVLGSLGILGAVYGAVSPLVMGPLARMMPAEHAAGVEAMQEFSVRVVLVSLLALAVAVWLLVGGIALVKRRRSSRKTCLTWAVVKMLFVVLNSVISYAMVEAQMEAMMQQSPNTPGMPAGFMSGFSAIGLVFGICWGWALPVFMLIWFSRGEIKAEVAQWE